MKTYVTVGLCVAALAAGAFMAIYGSNGFGLEDIAALLVIGGLMLGALVVASFRLFERGANVIPRLVPLAVWLVTVVVLLKPPTNLNFLVLRSPRERAVAMIDSGAIAVTNGVANVSAAGPFLSAGGNEAMVDGCGRETCVLFFVYRGILHHYSGYLYVPTGGKPGAFDDIDESRGWYDEVAPNWYYAGQ